MDNPKSGSCYRKITVEGVVQGVGFRPFVYGLATSLGVCGSVANTGGAVEIYASGSTGAVDEFTSRLRTKAPPLACIAKIRSWDTAKFCASGFTILASGEQSALPRYIPPDAAICADCKQEVLNPNDKRFMHFFNSCVNCGPRFTIIEKLPYDRENTTMNVFAMCGDCEEEYNSPADRRFHAETVACNNCGPKLSYAGRTIKKTGTEAFAEAVAQLKNGNIVAIKGIGGYHFACSPFDNEAALALRTLKGRESKPFAVVFRDIGTISEYCEINSAESEILQSAASPIVLLNIRNSAFASGVLSGSSRCGCFLPYSPLHVCLLEELGALVMTSANISGSAIITDDNYMEDFFAKSACAKFAGVLGNDRKIARCAEDSVGQLNCGYPQIIRRARGYAPAHFELSNCAGQEFLAIGGDLKAAFALVKDGRVYLSQYFGDLAEVSVFERFKKSVGEQMELFGVKPRFVVCDTHPLYFSSAFAKELGLLVFAVQHHHAHAASVLAEHGIFGGAIAVCFDGTGYGDDGAVWGGEFFICRGGEFARAGHLRYTKLFGGDSSAADAKKTALSFLIEYVSGDFSAFDDSYAIAAAATAKGVNTVNSSSVGRLFDAVSALLGVCAENEYEGQCAILLQEEAETALQNGIAPADMAFGISRESGGGYIIDPASVIKSAYCENSLTAGAFALGFHITLANAVADVCGKISAETGISDIAISGGVFQNTLLTELTAGALSKIGLNVYMNRAVPPNDGGISLGQAYLGGFLCV